MHGYKKCSYKDCHKTESFKTRFKECSRCHAAVYCSEECHSKDWKNRHRRECRKKGKEWKKVKKAVAIYNEVSKEVGGVEKLLFELVWCGIIQSPVDLALEKIISQNNKNSSFDSFMKVLNGLELPKKGWGEKSIVTLKIINKRVEWHKESYKKTFDGRWSKII